MEEFPHTKRESQHKTGFTVTTYPNIIRFWILLQIRETHRNAGRTNKFASDLLLSSTLLHPVLASSFTPWQDFSKRASFPLVCVDWFYKKAVWGVVKSWEFEGTLRCSKILRIRRKRPIKWVLSISRDYWVYLDITLQSFEIWEFWGELWEIETFYRSKFSPATGITIKGFHVYMMVSCQSVS